MRACLHNVSYGRQPTWLHQQQELSFDGRMTSRGTDARFDQRVALRPADQLRVQSLDPAGCDSLRRLLVLRR